jgi:hypothetical protein
MPKAEKLAILNSRRLKLKENSIKLREEKERLTSRIERLRSSLNQIEFEESALEDLIIDQLTIEKLKVSVHVVEEFAPTRNDRLMLMIQIDGILEPVFKMLSMFEVELLAKLKNTGDKLAFDYHIHKLALGHIQVLRKLNEQGDFNLNLEYSVEKYLDDFTVEPRINRHFLF